MTGKLRIDHVRSQTLELFLALQREVAGRFAWEITALPRPVTPQIAQFRDGVQSWRRAGLDQLPAWLAAPRLSDLTGVGVDPAFHEGAGLVTSAIEAARADLEAALADLDPLRSAAIRTLDDQMRLEEVDDRLRTALGATGEEFTLPLHTVTLAPWPSIGFLSDGNRLAGAYLDCRRNQGSMLIEGVLTLLGWALLRDQPSADGLMARLAERLPGSGPYHRRLRAVAAKTIVEMTAGALTRVFDPEHQVGVTVQGTAWRYPRLYGAVERAWGPYLNDLADRDDALDSLAAELTRYRPHWFVDHVDASSLVADFYLLEYLAASGDADGARRLEQWTPQLAKDLVGQLDLVIGAELGHYERAPSGYLPEPLREFLHRISEGDSQAAWPRVRAESGAVAALEMAAQAFRGPGVEFGGEAWAPIAEMLRRYLANEMPQRVFIDQCFTLQHNNGSLLDKYFDVENVQSVLDAQASGRLETLAAHASEEVREAWLVHRSGDHSPAWLAKDPRSATGTGSPDDGRGWFEGSVFDAVPGGTGCGSAGSADSFAPSDSGRVADRVRARNTTYRRPLPADLMLYSEASVVVHTQQGDIEVDLWPQSAPYTIDNFLKLASGLRAWTDPETGARRTDPFYDGTRFYRRVPGFLIQGGDRTETGLGGPGYRIPDEFNPDLAFDRPYLMAMANAGTDGTGSQFFITVAPAPHLTNHYALLGEVRDTSSRLVVDAISQSADPTLIHRVSTVTRPS